MHKFIRHSHLWLVAAILIAGCATPPPAPPKPWLDPGYTGQGVRKYFVVGLSARDLSDQRDFENRMLARLVDAGVFLLFRVPIIGTVASIHGSLCNADCGLEPVFVRTERPICHPHCTVNIPASTRMRRWASTTCRSRQVWKRPAQAELTFRRSSKTADVGRPAASIRCAARNAASRDFGSFA